VGAYTKCSFSIVLLMSFFVYRNNTDTELGTEAELLGLNTGKSVKTPSWSFKSV